MQLRFRTIVSMGMTNSYLKLKCEEHLRLRINFFLKSWGEPYLLRNVMRMTCSTVFNSSSFQFVMALPCTYSYFGELFISVGARESEHLLKELVAMGYAIHDSKGTVLDDFRRLEINPFLQFWTCLRSESRKRTIVVGTSTTDSSLLPCLGTGNTALMNSLGPDSIWMAYPRWTFLRGSLTSAWVMGTASEYKRYRRVVTRIVEEFGVFEVQRMGRLIFNAKHPVRCGTGECPQANRDNEDSSSLNVYFGIPSRSRLANEGSRREGHKAGFGVVWRLGRYRCFNDTVQYETFASIVGEGTEGK